MTGKKPRTALFTEPVAADDVVVRCVRLSDALTARVSALLSGYGVTILQYNVLRILYVRDAEGQGLPSGVIGTGLMVQKPNVTRLLDRLTEVGLVERFRPEDDRRVVKVRLTRAGTDLVEKVHGPLVEHNRELLRSIPQGDLKRLAQLLGRALDAVR